MNRQCARQPQGIEPGILLQFWRKWPTRDVSFQPVIIIMYMVPHYVRIIYQYVHVHIRSTTLINCMLPLQKLRSPSNPIKKYAAN